ncbi:MAG: fatty acid desaturase [Bdellovibrionales bacterium]|nr:fatty acid desaturase [Bdellovibrionales bacterium]
MKKTLMYNNKNISIPSNLNIFLAVSSIGALWALLYLTEHTDNWWIKIVCILLFSYTGNTTFSLLHEAVHSNFHHLRKVNYFFGNICASMFPTAYSFQKRCHLNHHRNNRTQYELFEMYDDKDNKVIKNITLYGVLTGIYWAVPFIGSLWLLLNPKSLLSSGFSGKDNYEMGRMGGASMLRSFDNLSAKEILRMRLEVLFTLAVQISMFLLLGLSFSTYIMCYFAFGFTWSALQYADHAFSVRDIRNGAWNLKVHPVTKAFFLNYHDHLAHHQHPNVPWIHLPKFVDPNIERPEFLAIYFKMWKGLVKLDANEPTPLDQELDSLIERENFTN